jgi:hypothetical protein
MNDRQEKMMLENDIAMMFALLSLDCTIRERGHIAERIAISAQRVEEISARERSDKRDGAM